MNLKCSYCKYDIFNSLFSEFNEKEIIFTDKEILIKKNLLLNNSIQITDHKEIYYKNNLYKYFIFNKVMCYNCNNMIGKYFLSTTNNYKYIDYILLKKKKILENSVINNLYEELKLFKKGKMKLVEMINDLYNLSNKLNIYLSACYDKINKNSYLLKNKKEDLNLW